MPILVSINDPKLFQKCVFTTSRRVFGRERIGPCYWSKQALANSPNTHLSKCYDFGIFSESFESIRRSRLYLTRSYQINIKHYKKAGTVIIKLNLFSIRKLKISSVLHNLRACQMIQYNYHPL